MRGDHALQVLGGDHTLHLIASKPANSRALHRSPRAAPEHSTHPGGDPAGEYGSFVEEKRLANTNHPHGSCGLVSSDPPCKFDDEYAFVYDEESSFQALEYIESAERIMSNIYCA